MNGLAGIAKRSSAAKKRKKGLRRLPYIDSEDFGPMRVYEPTWSEGPGGSTSRGAVGELADSVSKPFEIMGRIQPLNYALSLAGSPYNMTPWTNAREFIHGPSQEQHKQIKEIIEELKDDPSLAETNVSLGGVRPLTEFINIFKNKKTGWPSKLFGGLVYPLQAAAGMAGFNRPNHYNPFSDTVNVESADPGVLRHELGHAQDFTEDGTPGGRALLPLLEQATLGLLPVPGTTMYLEYRANRNAMNKALQAINKKEKLTVADKKKIDYLNQIFGGSYGSYSGALVGGLAGGPVGRLGGVIGMPIGATTARATEAWSRTDDEFKKYREKLDILEKEEERKRVNRRGPAGKNDEMYQTLFGTS